MDASGEMGIYDFGDMKQRHLIPNTKQWVWGGVVWAINMWGGWWGLQSHFYV